MIPTDENSVDGFSDNAQGQVSEPDPGVAEGAQKPLSPEEYAAAQKEIREQGDNNDDLKPKD